MYGKEYLLNDKRYAVVINKKDSTRKQTDGTFYIRDIENYIGLIVTFLGGINFLFINGC